MAGLHEKFMNIAYSGDAVPTHKGKAVSWRIKAAEQGHSSPQYNLAGYYSNGDGIPADKAKDLS